jgi:hypothetical protein
VVVAATLPAEVVTVVAGRLSLVTSGLVVVVEIRPSCWDTPEVEVTESVLEPSGSEPGSPPQATKTTRLKSRVLLG